MKKKLKLMTMLITSFFVGATFVSCNASSDDDSNANAPKEIVYDAFEKWENDFSRIILLNDFGKVSKNDDKDFVKFGTSSAKLEPSGGTYSNLKPVMLFSMESEMFDYDYRDFTNVECVSVWLYNAEERDINVGIGLASSIIKPGQWNDKLDRTSAIQYSLKSGWNYIEYKLEPQYLSCYSKYKSNNVEYVCFEFDYTNPLKEKAPVLYMDDMRLHYASQAVLGNAIELKANESEGVWELADFEDCRQVLFTSVKADTVKNRLCSSIVNASKYNVLAASGKNVLEILRRPGSSSETQGWPQLYISEKTFEKAFSLIGEEIIQNPQNYEIKFEYYNASPIEQSVNVTYATTCGKGDITPWVGMTAKPYTWNTYTISVQKIQETLLEAYTNEKIALYDGYSESNYMKYPGNMTFTMDGFSLEADTRERVLLLDNLRIERVKAE